MKDIRTLLQTIREEKPLIHHITNFVTMNFLANGVLAAGGSPMMAHSEEEAEEAVAASAALVLNIGTIDPSWLRGMIAAGKKAKEQNIPVVLDPVGVGLSRLRSETVRQLIEEVRPDLICGNAAELSYLYEGNWSGKGVDGELDGTSAQLAQLAARKFNTAVAITGEQDYVSDGSQTIAITGGHEMLAYVTGTGCFSSSMIALFLAKGLETECSIVERAAAALTMLGLAAERAIETANGPGTFQVHLLDALFNLKSEELTTASRWSEM
ncbi:hydroxyethylthiazole kinase [Fictibacillus macauensis ZFHKF-1]|uniref:Hydroxyethylthiazole kinase n=1 Tax=Fictibacillus macauensis ZFHKF-1 TaxID=1196324 RepID=I8J3H2_9BACL|nr:hydroxyethylthiazole kinase [Fictibacillus macauensis]EIT86326.1 hydroxyethylthiazole kinase [Fictibacillus macauensis ZFHKF-1]